MTRPPKPPVIPSSRPEDVPRLAFRRGRRFPRAIAWYGGRSLWGHIWHLFASVIATEDIDSRDWMRPDHPDELTGRVAEELGAPPGAPTLTEALAGDLWIDFVADTGDDVSVSAAVARMIFDTYQVDEGGEARTLPRGHMLVFGGDTAYPVATELEIHNRVIVPFNAVLRGTYDGTRRVLLGVPGNHDWYGGLDGFGRMFRARRGQIDRASRVVEADTIDRAGNIGHFFRWVEAFRVGRLVAKRPGLPLEGYTPVQGATYWALHLAPGLSMWGADRQLRAVDFQQRVFFAEVRDRDPAHGLVLCVADPCRAFLEPSACGVEILEALQLSFDDGLLVMTGDNHHYCREEAGRSTHVTAGGGGAFLHPARIRRRGLPPPVAEFPGPRASLALALTVPLAIARGRSGFLVHVAVALAYAPAYGFALESGSFSTAHAAGTAGVCALVAWMLGGWRSPKAIRILGLALLLGALLGLAPLAAERTFVPLLVGLGLSSRGALHGALVFAVFAGAFLFGAYLAALTIFGLEQHQAFGALAHPGYKHFVRLRVKRDGSAVDGWVLGKVDPLARDERVVLVDRFTWRNPAATKGEAPTRPG